MADDEFWAEAARQRHIAFGRPRPLSDQEIARERAAQSVFFPALARFQAGLRHAAALSSLMEDDLRYLKDALDDHAPSQTRWDEKIAHEPT